MPIEYRSGDIFASGCQALVNPVNCVGVMGAGLAAEFKRRFWTNYAAYKKECKLGTLQIGQPHVFELSKIDNPQVIINFPTKNHWRDQSRLVDISAGLDVLLNKIIGWDILSIALPALGCGLGGLAWPDVRACIQTRLGALEGVRVVVYEPLDLAKPRPQNDDASPTEDC